MAKIRTRKGRLYIDYYDEAGKRHRKTLHLKANRENKKKAELEKKKVEYELEAGVHVEKIKRDKNRNITLKEGYEEYCELKKRNSKTTLVHYKNSFDTIASFENRPLNSIKLEMIELRESQLLTEGMSPNSVASYFGKLRNMYDYFIRSGYVNQNPIPMRKMKPKKIVTVPEKEMLMILDSLKEKNRKHYKVIFLMLSLGLRRSEVVNLDWKDIDMRKKIVAVQNAKDKERIDFLPIYDEVLDFFMKEFSERHGKVFNYKSGDSLKFFSKFLKREGFNHYTLHTLRKTFISRLVNSGFSVFDVKTLARHKNIKTTLEHYTEMEIQRMGNQISERANMGTLLGTQKNVQLKLVKTG